MNYLRYVKFLEMSSQVKQLTHRSYHVHLQKGQKLPPTERAACFHSLRVHLHADNALEEAHMHTKTCNWIPHEQWGWKLDGTTQLQSWLLHQTYLSLYMRWKCKLEIQVYALAAKMVKWSQMCTPVTACVECENCRTLY